MLKIAVITPTALLDTYATLGDHYHLCLSAEVLTDAAYAAFYRERARAGDYVILDNSAHEQLEGDSLSKLIAATMIVNPSEIVLPDRLFFGDDTLERSSDAYATLRACFPTIKLMGVPQGRTVTEWGDCLRGLDALGVDTIGISKDYEVWADGEGLVRLVHYAKSVCRPGTEIHLLGWGRKLHQIARLADMVRGIDSAKPLVYAQHGVRLPHVLTNENLPKYPRRSGLFFEAKSIPDDIAHHNIDVFRTYASDTFVAHCLACCPNAACCPDAVGA